jgi:hypothetical protein
LENKTMNVYSKINGFKKTNPPNIGEEIFQGKYPNCIKWPFTFLFYRGEYTPDFWDPKENCFYEVIGTSARYYQGQNKALVLRKALNVKLVFCKPDGTVLMPRFKARGKSYLITGSKRFSSHAPNSDYTQETEGLISYGKKILN